MKKIYNAPLIDKVELEAKNLVATSIIYPDRTSEMGFNKTEIFDDFEEGEW